MHQPVRLKYFPQVSVGKSVDPYEEYFDHALNREIFEKVARKSYIPTHKLLLDLIQRYDGRFKVTFSFTGTLMDYCKKYSPGLIDDFKELVASGCVDFFEETYFHSLASMYDTLDEFEKQITLHRTMMKKELNYEPSVFCNTEAIYDNRIAEKISNMKYEGIITEGVKSVLGWRSPNYLYTPHSLPLSVLLRNYSLSDDIGFRFSNHRWVEYPLTADKYAKWLANSSGDVINIFIDYETLGEHQWDVTGIFDFLRYLPEEVLKFPDLHFVTAPEAVKRFQSVGVLDVPWAISWADEERNVSTWLGNDMQKECFYELQHIGYMLNKQQQDPDLYEIWRLLQTSDHLYYVSTKGFEVGAIHSYFSPYKSPYDAYSNYKKILQDFLLKIKS